MARRAQPRDLVQLPLGVPAPLQRALVRRPRHQVVVRQRHPVARAQLAGGRARRRPHGRRRGGGGGDVRGQRGGEQRGDGREAVGGERFGDGGRGEVRDGLDGAGGEERRGRVRGVRGVAYGLQRGRQRRKEFRGDVLASVLERADAASAERAHLDELGQIAIVAIANVTVV